MRYLGTSSKHYQQRIADAIARDERNIIEWTKLGWKVIVVWDRCQLEDKRKFSQKRDQTLETIKQRILK